MTGRETFAVTIHGVESDVLSGVYDDIHVAIGRRDQLAEHIASGGTVCDIDGEIGPDALLAIRLWRCSGDDVELVSSIGDAP